MRMQQVQSIVVMCESEMGGLQSCNRWKIVYSAAMQSSSQLLSGNYSGSYVTEGLGVGWGVRGTGCSFCSLTACG